MQLNEIVNLTAAELKVKRQELMDSIEPDKVLAARFLQALTDAKLRDEKLAEQGITISNLNTALARTNSKIVELEAALTKANERIDLMQADNTKVVAEMTDSIMRAATAEQRAKARRVALASIMALISPLLAAEG